MAWYNERHNFNKGVCSKCGGHLKWVDSDSQGGRLHMCENCHHGVCVSYPFID